MLHKIIFSSLGGILYGALEMLKQENMTLPHCVNRFILKSINYTILMVLEYHITLPCQRAGLVHSAFQNWNLNKFIL